MCVYVGVGLCVSGVWGGGVGRCEWGVGVCVCWGGGCLVCVHPSLNILCNVVTHTFTFYVMTYVR